MMILFSRSSLQGNIDFVDFFLLRLIGKILHNFATGGGLSDVSCVTRIVVFFAKSHGESYTSI
jgi:hypothetical protein